MKYDYLIVGAGFAGLVFAERVCTVLGKRCLIVDKRQHFGGNAYDEYDKVGVLIHKYGPHYFRTNSSRVRDYLSQFTQWKPVEYKVLSYTDGRYWSFPINLKTFEQMMGRPATESEFIDWLQERKVKIDVPQNSEEVVVSQVGWELYERFFRGYTRKQWRLEPKQLDASVCGRIPIRTISDDRYFSDSFQALPAGGYTNMFGNMLDRCGELAEVQLRTDYRDLIGKIDYDTLVYTGPIDEFFDCRFGPLPYRSLRFEPESFTGADLAAREAISGVKGCWQPALQVNYPNDHDFTRIVEMKHATGQVHDYTTIVREYPDDYGPGKEPYYPIPTAHSSGIYKAYEALAERQANALFIGRLATYRYYNMDQVVGMALSTFERHAAQIQPASRRTDIA